MALTRPRALQIFDLDYKQAVRAVTTTNVTLSGGAPATVDGVALAVNDRILVNGQGTASQNGIYEVGTLGTGNNGTWVRTVDAAVSGTLNAGTIVMVTEGTVFADTQFKLLTDDPIVIGTTPLNFEQNSAFAFGNIFANGTAVLANSVGDSVIFDNGNNIVLTGNATSKSVTIAVTESPSFTGTLDVTGNATVGNLSTAGQVAATGNITGGNLTTAGQVVADGNISGGNVQATAAISAGTTIVATGNVTGGNVVTAGVVDSGTLSVTGNANVGNLSTAGLVDAGSITSATTIAATGNVSGGNLVTVGLTSTSTLVATGNISGGNLTTTGETFTGTLRSTGDALINGNLTVQGNLTYINIDDLRVQDPVIILGTGPNGAPLTADDGLDRGVYMEYYTTETANAFMGLQNASGNMIIANNVEFASNDVIQVNSFGTFQAGNAYLESAEVVGNITAGNITTGGTLNTTGNLSANNLSATNSITAGTTIVATGNVTGGNLVTAGVVDSGTLSVTGNANVGNLSTAGEVTVTGNVSGGNVVTAGVVDAGSITSATTIDATGNVSGGNVTTAGQVAATGNVSGGNLVTAGEVTATGNVSGGNVVTAGAVDAGTIASADTITATGNISGGNLLTIGGVTATGNIAGDFFIGNGRFLTGIDTTVISNGSTEVRTYENGNVAFTVAGTSNVVVVTTDSVLVSGNVSATDQVTATGNVSGGNLVTAGAVDAGSASITGNISGGNASVSGLTSTNTLSVTANANVGNLGTAGEIVATGNITGGNLITAGSLESASLSVTGNVDAGNLNSNGSISTAGNINGGNLNLSGSVDAAGNVTAGNVNATVVIANLVTTANIVSTTGTIGNITISDSNINSDASAITINSDATDVDFAINGDTNANVFYVDAGTETVSIGNSTQTASATLAINSTDSLLMPRGNIAQRPSGTIGMVRFNTETDGLEQFTQDGWEPVGTEFTVIDSETFAGDNSTVAFTLATEQTTNSCIISINGIVQEPGTAYAVSGTTLTFTEAPLDGDTIEVRALTTTVTAVSISNSIGNAKVAVTDTSNNVTITGDLIPNANVTFDLGSTTARWNELFLAGDTIVLGDVVIKNTGGNTIGFFGADGTTPGTIDTDNIDSAGISNGTSSLTVVASGGNIQANVADSTVGVFSSTGLVVTGSIEATNGFIGLDATSVANGTANLRTFENANVTVSAGGVANVLVVTGTGANISGTLNVTGNITGANLVTVGVVQAANLIVSGIETVDTLNVIGDTLISGNLTVSGTTFTANVATLTITDPVLGLGSGANGAPLTTNDGLDRGIKMFYYTDAEQIAFVGYDNSAGKLLSAANVTVANNVVTVNSLGTTTVGVLETSEIVKTGANGVGNIGSDSNTFNVVFARATSALYADLAEQYLADDTYGPGTVLVFGGSAEVTSAAADADHRVAGVVSTNPGYIMNAGLTGEHVVQVALTGRVPCQVIGPVSKGDLMVSAADGHARADNSAQAGTIIGKALEDFAGESGVIEVVVGKH